jgi:hypothetical protein
MRKQEQKQVREPVQKSVPACVQLHRQPTSKTSPRTKTPKARWAVRKRARESVLESAVAQQALHSTPGTWL